MTKGTRHSRAPLRRTSTREKVLSASLATATCVGVVGLVGARTIDANASSATPTLANAAQPLASTADGPDAQPTTSSGGLTVQQLDAYAAQLTAEEGRLDAYRAKLVKTANRLQRIAAREAVAGSRVAPSTPRTSPRAVPSPPTVVVRPKAQPAPKAAPKPHSQPAPQAAPKPHSNTKSS